MKNPTPIIVARNYSYKNCAMKLQSDELRQDNTRLQTTLKEKKNVVKPTMIERSSNTDTLETMSITPSISKAPYDPSKPSSSPDVLPLESCTMLWAVENKIVPHFDLHQLYELHPYLFLSWLGENLKNSSTKSNFKQFGLL